MVEPLARFGESLTKPEIPPRKVKSAIPFCDLIVSRPVNAHRHTSHQGDQVNRAVLPTICVLNAKRVSRIRRDTVLPELVRKARDDGAGSDASAGDAKRTRAMALRRTGKARNDLNE